MCSPAAVASALKLAGPSAHPRMRECRSSDDSANIRQYSSNDRPHGTTCSRVNTRAIFYCFWATAQRGTIFSGQAESASLVSNAQRGGVDAVCPCSIGSLTAWATAISDNRWDELRRGRRGG